MSIELSGAKTMENEAAMVCPNETCLASNKVTNNYCQQCRTPLPKRYLWAVAEDLSMVQPKELLAERYLVISKAIVLDTKPGIQPQTPDVENLQAVRPYLRLFAYRLYIPQVYGFLHIESAKQEILLLEKPPLRINTDCLDVHLASALTTAWRDATSMRQLNWLWQIAHLWEPLVSESVAKSLLTPEVLRVEGSLVRLLELRHDKQIPSLAELGRFWQQQLCQEAKPAIAEFVREICRSLVTEEIRSCEQLIAVLDKGLAEVGRQKSTIKIATKSDIGPNRPRNEDACYPPSGSLISKPPQSGSVAIVCDGIGGHEGGNVASNLAIDTIVQQLCDLIDIPPDHINPQSLLNDLETAAAAANDKISQRNDSEHRQGRQRMGTTLVMALPVAHEMYIAHVGDSRAYWITRCGCYQVTLDDDVASREVRLGYATYRDAVQQGASGSLVQALGMGSSNSLHPTAQRFILDEDCIFLLCSDGLSDFDRVEQHWETEILPILNKNLDLATATDKLVEIANNENGHDNVTIALVHCQVQYSEPKSSIKPVTTDISTPLYSNRTTIQSSVASNHNQKTEVASSDRKPSNTSSVPLQPIVISILLLVAALLGLAWQNDVLSLLLKKIPVSSSSDTTPSVSLSPGDSQGSIEEPRVIVTNRQQSFMTIATSPSKGVGVNVPADSILLEINPNEITSPNEPENQGDSWVYLRVCSVGKISGQSKPLKLAKGQVVRIQSSQYKELKFPAATQTQKSQCQSKPKSPTVDSPQPLTPNPS